MSSIDRVARAEPGSPVELEDTWVASLLPDRAARSHKGNHGRLVCVAGSLDYVGAALLAGSAAVRMGTGLVALAVPAEIQPVVAGRVPELITIGLPGDPDVALSMIDERQPTALVVGPGLGEMDAQAALVEALIGDQRRPLVLDGGALNLLARSGDWPSRCRAKAVLTPHPGEFARLTREAVGDDNSERVARAVEAANRFGQVVVLKGARTVIASPDGRVCRAPFENAALATAGTGDVLAGVIGGLLAQGLDPYDAACVGVFLHGAAGQRLSERLGDSGLLASELPLEIALARAQLARRRGSSATVGFGRRPGGAG